jgi:hypothetical protein
MELDNGSEDSDTPEQQNISAVPIIPSLNCPTPRSMMKVETALITVNITEMRRNHGIQNK